MKQTLNGRSSLQKERGGDSRTCRRSYASPKEVTFKPPIIGNLSPTLRTMQEVSVSHLESGHTFPDRIVLLRVAEGDNFKGINYTVLKGDDRQL